MTAVSSSSVCTVSNVGGCWAIAEPSVSVPSTGEGAPGSAVITKKCSQPSVCSKPPWPAFAIGRSSVPSKQKYAFASESSRW